MNPIFTIGYEKAVIGDFIATLKCVEIDVLVDIRAVTVSRKPGFSKKSLAENLKNAQIGYVHLCELGDPKPGREAARRGDMADFRRIFGNHLRSEAAQNALKRALDIASNARACLLCFERHHADCHRAIVAEEMAARRSLQVRHIGVRNGLSEAERYDDFRVGRAYVFG